LVEAQSQRLACVATNVSGIPELIEQGVTGLLTPPDDPSELAQAMSALIRDPARRAALGAAGERRVRGNFSMRSGIDVLGRRFGLSPGNLQAVNLQGAAFRASHETHRLEEDAVFQVSDSSFPGVLVPQRSEN
jgi:Glycosyl transferases group 1